jgi:hypothetical protein
MTSTVRTVPIRWRRLVPAALLAAAATLGGSALGYPAIADAAQEWDIGEYDLCVAGALAAYQSGKITFQDYNQKVKDCCIISSGIWSETQGCGAPPANEVGHTVRPGAINQTMTPAPVAPPPGDITQTFTPAP